MKGILYSEINKPSNEIRLASKSFKPRKFKTGHWYILGHKVIDKKEIE
jgi:hypothetical protein